MHVCKFLAQLLLDESWQATMDRWRKAEADIWIGRPSLTGHVSREKDIVHARTVV